MVMNWLQLPKLQLLAHQERKELMSKLVKLLQIDPVVVHLVLVNPQPDQWLKDQRWGGNNSRIIICCPLSRVQEVATV